MFKGELVVSPLADGKLWEVKEKFSFCSLQYPEWVDINPGFVTDFASIPMLLQWYEQPATGKHRRASIAHDFLYQMGLGSRKDADDTFLYLMNFDGVSYMKRYAMYWAVRAFGGLHYAV